MIYIQNIYLAPIFSCNFKDVGSNMNVLKLYVLTVIGSAFEILVENDG